MFYLVANLKSNLTLQDIAKYAEFLDKGLQALNITKEIKIILSPSNIYLYVFKQLVAKYDFLSLCAQDVSEFGVGAHTGDVNAIQIKDYCDYCIVGHSERRKSYKETDAIILNKISTLNSGGITPIVCVSNLDEITSVLHLKDKALVAFEPIDYIGGNVSAPIDFVNSFIINSNLKSAIYGGSVNLDNCDLFIKNPLINGMLVGGFSLNPVEFLKLIQKTNNLLEV